MKILLCLLIFSSFLRAEDHPPEAGPDAPRKLDIDSVIKELNNMECTDETKSASTNPGGSLCPHDLKMTVLSPLGFFGSGVVDFYKYLDENFYKPLAYNMIRRTSLSELIDDLAFLDPKFSVLNGVPLQDNYGIFKDSILHHFADIQGKTSDMEKNHAVLNELIIQMLKRFHLYWNTLRSKNQTAKIKDDTVAILKELSNSFDEKQSFLTEVTQKLVEQLKDGYFRFMRAHKMIEILNVSAAEILVNQIVSRFQAVCDLIKESKYNEVKIVKETYFLMRMVQSYHIVNYKNGLSEPLSINQFNTQIFIRIQTDYEMYKSVLQFSDPIRLKRIRDFTATFLLKCKHLMYIIFNYHHISEIVNYTRMHFEFDSKRVTKVYNEMLDGLMLIPMTCVNFFALKSCSQHETNRILRYVSLRYHLKRSTSGWEIYDYLKMMMQLLFRNIDDLAFSNWSIYKQAFYQNLFIVMKDFQKFFVLQDDDCIDELQGFIGKAIQKFKEANYSDITDFGIIDLLQKKLYRNFLDLKGEYNNKAPYDHNPTVLSNIQRTTHNYLSNFIKLNNAKIDDKSVQVIKLIEDTVESWVHYMMSKPNTSIQVSNMITPFVTNLATATYSNIPSDKTPIAPPAFITHMTGPADGLSIDLQKAENQQLKRLVQPQGAKPKDFESLMTTLSPESNKILNGMEKIYEKNTSSFTDNVVMDSASDSSHRTI